MHFSHALDRIYSPRLRSGWQRIPRTVVLVMALLMLGGCSLFVPDLRPPEVALRGVVLERTGLREQIFRVYLDVSNPNDRVVRVAEARLALQVEQIDLGEGTTTEPLTLPANGRSRIVVRVATDVISKAPDLLSWLMSGDPDLDYRVSGFIDVGGAGMVRIPVNETGRVSIGDLSRYTGPSV